MRAMLLRCGVALALGLGVPRAMGQDPSSPADPSSAAPAPRRFVTLSRPLPLPQAPALATQPGLVQPAPLIRAKNDDEPRPLPSGPGSGTVPKGDNGDNQADDIQFQPARPKLIQVPPEAKTISSQPPQSIQQTQPKIVPVEPKDEAIPMQPRIVPQPMPQSYQLGISPTPLPAGPAFDTGTHGLVVDDNGRYQPNPCCGSSSGGCFDCLDGCCYPRGKIWARSEYLLWTFKTPNLPPLVTTGPGTDGLMAGTLGRPGTSVLYGGNEFNNQPRSGGRTNFGFWFPHHDDWGLETDYLFTGWRTTNFGAAGGPPPFIGRPVIETSSPNPGEAVEVVSGLQRGGVVGVDYLSRIWGAELNLRRKGWCGPRFHVDMLFGFRHFEVEEDLIINEYLTGPPGMSINTVRDQFSTHNRFNGGQIGIEAECRFLRRWFASGQFKVAVGNVQQIVVINGSQTIDGGFFPVGVLANGANLGRYERHQFAVLPEANVKVGMDITDQLRIFVGYNMLYLSNAVRPGDIIDRKVNSLLQPPATGMDQRSFFFHSTEFWAQGLSAGLEYRW